MRALGVSRGNITMILEVAILNIRPGESADFGQAFAEVQAIIASMPGYGWGAFSGLLKRTRATQCFVSGCGHAASAEGLSR
jgi:hypothetical protein